MRKNLAAVTLTEAIYPGFVSINDEGCGMVSITVRSPAKVNNGIAFGVGDMGTVTLNADQWAAVKRALTA